MPTIGEVYGPLVEAAMRDDPRPDMLLLAVGEEILKANPDRCRSLADGIEAAKRNLGRYAGYFPEDIASKVWHYFRFDDPSFGHGASGSQFRLDDPSFGVAHNGKPSPPAAGHRGVESGLSAPSQAVLRGLL